MELWAWHTKIKGVKVIKYDIIAVASEHPEPLSCKAHAMQETPCTSVLYNWTHIVLLSAFYSLWVPGRQPWAVGEITSHFRAGTKFLKIHSLLFICTASSVPIVDLGVLIGKRGAREHAYSSPMY